MYFLGRGYNYKMSTNGLFQIHVIPSEDLSKQQKTLSHNLPIISHQTANVKQESHDGQKEPSELFSRALKRKFNELDEITQRLRLRLSEVTEEDSDASTDGASDQFERDINSLVVEDDFDLMNFEEEAKKFNLSQVKEKDIHFQESGLLMTNLKKLEDANIDNKESAKNCSLHLKALDVLSVDALDDGECFSK